MMILKRILAWFLMSANSNVPFVGRADFYVLKARLLRRYATPLKIEWQHIQKGCWTCNATGYYLDDVICRHCCGTGIYREFFVPLQAWDLEGYCFHTPGDRVQRATFSDRQNNKPDSPIIYHGKICHQQHWAANEAFLWLILCFTPHRFWDMFTRYCKAYPVGFLSMLQRIVFWARLDVRRSVESARYQCQDWFNQFYPNDFDEIPF